ncbi:Toa1p [Sugiyamaella lignohabitans]|uniref:Toa1p n=1 Tax=Sugiyamaella lignohabitans TaxID=796027 RepID=A0A161HKR6_9ASCO|nr:Toa1p [Sugiyamaella lignohabitans]ANB12408.1 Toa1p [Sugiyamaella lignohabitans]
MSNDIVGKLYAEVIEGVVADSRPDFEDSGIDEATLMELKDIWQQRLSSFGVAKLPWDIEEEVLPPLPIAEPALEIPPQPTVPAANNPVRVKIEPSQPTTTAPPGIMLPTSSNVDARIRSNDLPRPNGGGLVLPGGGHITQADGPGDDDGLGDSDPDGINSDLDDSDDGLNSAAEDEDDDGGMIMLCLYDKVQRVKNKWKYVLKDGVANINGKDYVFSRGSGESEW